jgi:hypothetical protein
MGNKPKTVEYEVVADFPGMLHNIGDKFTVYEDVGMAYVTDELKEDVRWYPHLFKKVEVK